MSVPAFPTTEAELDDLLSAPSVEVGQALAALGGDIVFLGAGGKIGPTMARMARREEEDGMPEVIVGMSLQGNAGIVRPGDDAAGRA